MTKLSARGVYGMELEILKSFGDTFLCRVQHSGSMKLGRNVSTNSSQIILMSSVKEMPKRRVANWNYETRVELDLKFPATELEGGSSLKSDSRLAAVHISMAAWILQKDVDYDPSAAKVAFLAPEFTAQLFFELGGSDPAGSLCTSAAKAKAQFGDASLILAPVWGGLEGSMHWTLLSFEKLADGTWKVDYKDSLNAMCSSCVAAAESICTLMSVALDQDLQMPASRSNKALQAKGSGTCGYYIIHWMDEAWRCHSGYGPAAAGYPEPSHWAMRLENMTKQIVKNKGIAAAAAEKSAKKKGEVEAALKQMVQFAKEISEDELFQAKVRERTESHLHYKTWATVGGCGKCRFSKLGSTCCNPEKISAKCKAEEMESERSGMPVVNGRYRAADYTACLAEIYAKMAIERGLCQLPSLKDPAGGYEVPGVGS